MRPGWGVRGYGGGVMSCTLDAPCRRDVRCALDGVSGGMARFATLLSHCWVRHTRPTLTLNPWFSTRYCIRATHQDNHDVNSGVRARNLSNASFSTCRVSKDT